jgi:Mn-dependent DtxR family transcriptional regulator
MTIQYDTDLRLQMHISNCFNAKNNVASAYRLLDEYLRHECGLDEHDVDDVIDRLEEQVAEHIIEIIESKQA